MFRKSQSGEFEVFLINRDKKEYSAPNDRFEEEEKELITDEILKIQRVNSEFKIKTCKINESHSLFNNLVYDKINNWNSQKFDVDIEATVKFQNKKKIIFKCLEKEKYFNIEENIPFYVQGEDQKDFKEGFVGAMKIDESLMKKGFLDNISKDENKKLTANVWVSPEFPIKPSDIINIISSLGNANEQMAKIQEFINQKEVKQIVEKNGFPIKLKIPINFLISIQVTFCQFKYSSLK